MSATKIIDNNKRAYFEYFIEETYEAGIVLVGSEVKSIRDGHLSLKDSFCIIKDNELWLIGAHIKPYEKGSFFNVEAKRNRKLLLKRAEIEKLRALMQQKGFTLVPTKAYFKQGLVKIEIGVAKGKELHDKRNTIADKNVKRDIARQIKEYNNR
ncbi:MAG: SsrA-binding protein SmpB [Clostridia bacterium]